jgi:hypothetical protein
MKPVPLPCVPMDLFAQHIYSSCGPCILYHHNKQPSKFLSYLTFHKVKKKVARM